MDNKNEIQLYDRIADILKSERRTTETTTEFKNILIELKQKFNSDLCREYIFRNYFKDINSYDKIYRNLLTKLGRFSTALNLKEDVRYRDYKKLVSDRTTGEVYYGITREALTYYII